MTPNHQLNLRQHHPDFQTFLTINENESNRVRNQHLCHLDVKYEPNPFQGIDIFPSNVPNSSILIFIHGGYWRALDKKSYSFIAEPFLKQNMTVAILNYRLIPSVNMEGLLGDIKAGIDWIRKEAHQYNGNPNAITISGHSAGGHLALMAYLMHEDLQPSIKAICSLSGLFDLAPIKNSYLNEVLQLTTADVENFSVVNKDLSIITCPTLLSVGGNETELFVEESKQLYHQHQSNPAIEYYEYPALNHYEIVHQLGQMDSILVNFIVKNN